MSLLLSWVLYALIATGFIIGFFAWAVRSGQFADQDRARYLPLGVGTGSNHEDHEDHEDHKGNRRTGSAGGRERGNGSARLEIPYREHEE